MTDLVTYARYVDEATAMLCAVSFIDLSMWFILTPMPDGVFEITVKDENKHRLNRLVDGE